MDSTLVLFFFYVLTSASTLTTTISTTTTSTLSPSASSFSSSVCFNRDSTPILDPAYQPCHPSTSTASMCCRLNTTSTADADTCLPNGLCLSQSGAVFREACTDSTWQSGECLGSVCWGGRAETPDTQPLLTQCKVDGKWCCGPEQDCCAAATRFELPATAGLGISSSVSRNTVMMVQTSLSSSLSLSSGTSTSSLALSTTTVAGTAITTQSNTGNEVGPQKDTQQTLSPAARVAIGVAAALGLSMGVVILVWRWVAARRRRLEAAERERDRESKVEKGGGGNEVVELEGEGSPCISVEMQSPRRIFESPGRSYETPRKSYGSPPRSHDSGWLGDESPVVLYQQSKERRSRYRSGETVDLVFPAYRPVVLDFQMSGGNGNGKGEERDMSGFYGAFGPEIAELDVGR